MGLTKQYLAYRAIDSFNIITSGRTNVNFLIYNQIEGRYVVCGAAENVIVWDMRLGERLLTLRRDNQEVTALRASPDRMHVAVGYSDGVVVIFDLATKSQVCSLALHKSAVSILRYDSTGIRLVSGGLDTELVVVDIIEQAGRQRLIGHNAPITDAHFLERLGQQDILITSSKDTLIKFWKLETQYCFKTIVDNRTEVWALAFVGNLMIAGCSESGMNVYRLKRKDDAAKEQPTVEAAVAGLSIDDEDTISPLTVSNCGIIQRAGKGRTVNLVVDPTERVLSCHGTNDLIENFYFCDESEVKKRLAKRLKKARKAQKTDHKDVDDKESVPLSQETSLTDEIRRLESIKANQKIKSIDVLLGAKEELRVLVSLANNSLQLYNIDVASTTHKTIDKEGEDGVKLIRAFTRLGHQSEVRTVCFSSDSILIGSGAGDSFKLWNRESMQCLRTASTDYALCSCFVPGDRYVLLGLKSGKLLIIEVGTADIIEEIAAHDTELWTISVLPDKKGCVTGSSDTSVKLWTFELIDNPNSDENAETRSKVLSLLHKNTLKLEETVLCACVSPDMKYLAVGLLDSTVKVFFLDSFKFYLSLYGHKLPVLCLDISYDSRIIATGSADRNVKIWGLDFGDCHRSLFAHDDSVMALQFIAKTHMFFTCGKDGKIKEWDGDSFEKILTLPGHIGESYGLAVSANGKYLVTCGSDRTMRLFERTEEPIVLEDVREEEREELENQHLATGEDNSVPLLPGLKMPSRKTVGSEKAAESILECLEICNQYEAEADNKPELHPLMRALKVENTDDFLLEVLARIRASDLEEGLLLLPFSSVCQLFERIPRLIENCCHEIELICKVTIFLFKIHFKPITNAKHMKPLLQKIIQGLSADITDLRDKIGMNLYAMQMMERQAEERDGVVMFRDATKERKKREKKRQEATKRTHIQMS